LRALGRTASRCASGSKDAAARRAAILRRGIAHLDAALVERYGAGVGAEQRGVSAEEAAEEAASRIGRYERCGRRPENAGRGIDHAS
jgi:hypothetical protein